MKVDNVALNSMNSASNGYPDKAAEAANMPDQAAGVQNAEAESPPQFNVFPAPNNGLDKVSEKSVIEAIENANKVSLTHYTRAEFSIHKETKRIIVKVVDTQTDKVIREFPPKKFLDLIAKLWDLAGIVVDERR